MKPLYKEKYPLLFTPLIVGKNKVEYKNRIFQAPMGMALGTDANGLINIIGEEYYSSFARGGFCADMPAHRSAQGTAVIPAPIPSTSSTTPS